MKNYFLLLLISILISCNNKSAKENSKSENASQYHAIDYIVGVGKVTPESDIIQLSSAVNGIVRKIYKKENDSVIIGTVILELEHDLEDAKLSQLRSEVATQTAQISVDDASVDEFEAKGTNAKSELIRLQNLLAKGAETQQTVDNASTDLKSFQANVNRLKANVIVSESRLKETESALQVAQIERGQKIISSPVNGKILELSVLIGGPVSIQQSLAQINPEGKTIAICEIDELNAEKVAVGQKGWIRNVGSSDTLSTGKIYFTSSFLKKKSLFTDQSGEKEDRRVMTIKMMLDQPGKLLLNSRVECVIDLSNN
jgi:multidrug resistance efflux pump